MLTEQQVAERKNYIGASDVASIMGLNPYRSASEVWAEKTGRMKPQSGNKATQAGNMLEPTILDYAEQDLGVDLVRDQVRRAEEYDFPLQVRCDAVYGDSEIPVEAKTAGLLNPSFDPWQDWGDEDTDGVPDPYLIQVTAQMMATGSHKAFVYALLSGRGFCKFTVHRGTKIVDAIAKSCDLFWTCVAKDTPPEGFDDMPMESLKRLYRNPENVSLLPDEIRDCVEERDRMKAEIKSLQAGVRELEQRIVFNLGDGEEGLLNDGRIVTFKEQTRNAYAVEAKTFRVLRIKKGTK